MQQSVIKITASCNGLSIVWNNWFLELQPTVILQFCILTAGCNFNHQLLHTKFCLVSVNWIKANGMIYTPIMFCPLAVELGAQATISTFKNARKLDPKCFGYQFF